MFPIQYHIGANSSESQVLKVCNDYRGNTLETLNPDQSKIAYAFDERGLPISEKVIGVDGKIISSKKVYDRTGKLIHETDFSGLKTSYEYDGFSRLSKILLPIMLTIL